MFVITKIRFSGSGKINMHSKGFKVHTHLIFSHVNVGNIIHGRGVGKKQAQKISKEMWVDVTAFAILPY